MKRGIGIRVAVVVFLCGLVPGAASAGGVGLDAYALGGILTGGGDYDWWYGCSPTSTGTLLGYYDRVGYAGQSYGNLIPGGVAEAETFTGPPTGWDSLAATAIASVGHVQDFYVAPFGQSGDDTTGPVHAFDCLADFMGTSQDAVGNSNGTTTFYFYNDGSAFSASDAVAGGVRDDSGTYGIGEYLAYVGYGAEALFNQYIAERGLAYGFTLDDYVAEIDAGRPVLIHTENHTLCGIGYDDADPSRIHVYDTWSPGPHPMDWAGTYGGAEQVGVTVLRLSTVPEPLTASAAGLALLALGGYLRRRRVA